MAECFLSQPSETDFNDQEIYLLLFTILKFANPSNGSKVMSIFLIGRPVFWTFFQIFLPLN